jgi:hypothetical protein
MAQLAARKPSKLEVAGSIPARDICSSISTVEYKISILTMQVRFLPRVFNIRGRAVKAIDLRSISHMRAQARTLPNVMIPWCSWLTRLLYTEKITGSNPVGITPR